ncbi:hypothetical protein KQX54_020765 [Cotesia glomerata]|uniref:Uncharacterized protein n=1 Tax=Cotesia glomerata TaxID=32391 RepID=A0AAV7IEG1_COTGL|nr:hypothetical protein KQX54_020765 [Cotesia glomerata]
MASTEEETEKKFLGSWCSLGAVGREFFSPVNYGTDPQQRALAPAWISDHLGFLGEYRSHRSCIIPAGEYQLKGGRVGLLQLQSQTVWRP